MSKSYFLYIVPKFSGPESSILAGAEIGPENFGWENIGSFANHINYIKTKEYTGHKWSITFHEYKKLNFGFFVIKCSDTTYEAENFTDSEAIFHNIRRECVPYGFYGYEKYIVKFFEGVEGSSCEGNGSSCCFAEIRDENQTYCVNNESCYHIRNTVGEESTKIIKEDLCTLLSLSVVACNFKLKSLKPEKTNAMVEFFWRQKSYLFKSHLGPRFPSFFENRMRMIDNLLDYNQVRAIETQSGLLSDIHKVESGILYLTLFVMVDVMFNILLVGIDLFPGIGRLDEFVISLILALVFSYLVYDKIKK